MTGMEMMVGNMLKSMGIDKDSILTQANEAAAVVKGVDARLTHLEGQIGRIETMCIKIIAFLAPGESPDNFTAHESNQLTIFEGPLLPAPSQN